MSALELRGSFVVFQLDHNSTTTTTGAFDADKLECPILVPFCLTHLGRRFELVGVVNHTGASPHSGMRRLSSRSLFAVSYCFDKLYPLTVCVGVCMAGHYTANVLLPASGDSDTPQWYTTDDVQVSPITLADVVTPQCAPTRHD